MKWFVVMLGLLFVAGCNRDNPNVTTIHTDYYTIELPKDWTYREQINAANNPLGGGALRTESTVLPIQGLGPTLSDSPNPSASLILLRLPLQGRTKVEEYSETGIGRKKKNGPPDMIRENPHRVSSEGTGKMSEFDGDYSYTETLIHGDRGYGFIFTFNPAAREGSRELVDAAMASLKFK
jgi:hypothetical protein